MATEPLPGLAGVLPARTGPAVPDSGRRLGWSRWALSAAGIALGVGLAAALLWPDGGGTATRPEARPTS